MTDPTIDEKIELLVRSVLEAVDARLGDVRNEVHALAADVRRQHDTVAQRLDALDQRVDAIGTSRHHDAEESAHRIDDGMQQQFERIEEMQQRHAIETDERFAEVNSAIDRLSDATARAITPTDTGPIPLVVDLDSLTAPLRMPPITGQHPVLLQEPPTTPSIYVAPTSIDLDFSIDLDEQSSDGQDREPIDLTQLADLLSERLGQLSLPPTPH